MRLTTAFVSLAFESANKMLLLMYKMFVIIGNTNRNWNRNRQTRWQVGRLVGWLVAHHFTRTKPWKTKRTVKENVLQRQTSGWMNERMIGLHMCFKSHHIIVCRRMYMRTYVPANTENIWKYMHLFIMTGYICATL